MLNLDFRNKLVNQGKIKLAKIILLDSAHNQKINKIFKEEKSRPIHGCFQLSSLQDFHKDNKNKI